MQNMNVSTWSDFKTLVTNKTLLMQYSESATTYDIFAPEANVFMWTICLLKGSSDATDFENNFKASANAPMMLNGHPIITPGVNEIVSMNAVAIRDTNPHSSSGGYCGGYLVKTIIINNGLDQAVTIQVEASRDNSNWFAVGSSFSISATTLTYQSTDDYFPYVRVTASAAISPTTGSISVWLHLMGE